MKRLTVLFVLILLVTAADAGADRGAYTIESFHSDLTVKPNSDLVVEETLQVRFQAARHGIYRTIPIRYTSPRGYAYSLGFRLLGVVDERGRSHTTKVTSEGRYVKIRIGDADRTVIGPVTYVIRYRVTDAVSHFTEHDELYWNAAGHEWQTTIARASAAVHLPAPLPSDSLEVSGYAGRFGSRAQTTTIRYPEPGTVLFTTMGTLGPLEGMTVAVAWPHGYVTFPGSTVRTARFFADNWILLIPLGVFFWLWRAYRRKGRDPEGPAAVMVRYEPPQGVTPGELGTLVDETVDLRDITAVTVDLAVRGYLIIRVEERKLLLGLISKDEIVFERKRDKSEEGLAPHERLILDGVFDSGDVVPAKELKQEFYKHIPGIQDALYERLTRQGYFAGKPTTVKNRYRGGGFLFGVLTAGVGLGWAALRGAFFPAGAIVPIVAGVLVLVLFLAFAPAMPRRTRKGVQVRSWALGFQEFVDRVERDRLDPENARSIFETLLPFAMALGIASKWAKRFEGIYEQASPAWYVGHGMTHGFSTQAFEESLTSSMTSVGQQMAASPRSSGSGGGGFSGGGGGGGGGGSW